MRFAWGRLGNRFSRFIKMERRRNKFELKSNFIYIVTKLLSIVCMYIYVFHESIISPNLSNSRKLEIKGEKRTIISSGCCIYDGMMVAGI